MTSEEFLARHAARTALPTDAPRVASPALHYGSDRPRGPLPGHECDDEHLGALVTVDPDAYWAEVFAATEV